MSRQVLGESQTSKAIFPLLLRPCYKGELMTEYFGKEESGRKKKLKHQDRGYRDGFFSNAILKPYLSEGIIVEDKNHSNDSKRKYFDINWRAFIEYYKDTKFKSLFANFREEKTSQLAKLCEKYREIVFGEKSEINKLAISPSILGYVTFSLFFTSLAIGKKFGKEDALKYLELIAKELIIKELPKFKDVRGKNGKVVGYDRIPPKYERIKERIVKSIKNKINKRNEADLEKLKETFCSLYITPLYNNALGKADSEMTYFNRFLKHYRAVEMAKKTFE